MADLSPNLLKEPSGLAPCRLENEPIYRDGLVVSYSRNSDLIRDRYRWVGLGL